MSDVVAWTAAVTNVEERGATAVGVLADEEEIGGAAGEKMSARTGSVECGVAGDAS